MSHSALTAEKNNAAMNTEMEEMISQIPHGDMPGDRIDITPKHIEKAKKLMPFISDYIQKEQRKLVIGVCGGSGVGKSETASLVAHYLNQLGYKTYILSGDNYPHRIPLQNDSERLRIFRRGGIRALMSEGKYNAEIASKLVVLQEQDQDCAPDASLDWQPCYIRGGRDALEQYLGTPAEIDFHEVCKIIHTFKASESSAFLKRMGRLPHELWYEAIDFSQADILIVEWTHANSKFLFGIDYPVLLNSTPAETLEHRRKRNRDGKVDSPFTTIVLEIEQALLASQAHKAKLIISKSGDILSYEDYLAANNT